MVRMILLNTVLVLSQLTACSNHATAEPGLTAVNAARSVSLFVLQADKERYSQHRDALLKNLKLISRPQRMTGAIFSYLQKSEQNKKDLPGLDTNFKMRIDALTSDAEKNAQWEAIFEEELKKAYEAGEGPQTELTKPNPTPPADPNPVRPVKPTTVTGRSNRIHKWAILNLFGRRKPCR